MSLVTFLLAATASAFGVVASMTGSWGAALWGVVLALLAVANVLYGALTAPQRGEAA